MDFIDRLPYFKVINDWQFVESQLAIKDETSRSRTLWFISTNFKSIPEYIVKNISDNIESYDSLSKGLAFKIFFKKGILKYIQKFLDSGWYWTAQKSHSEKHWGSLILCKYASQVPFKEICRRTIPHYLGYAVDLRGLKADEIHLFTSGLNSCLNSSSNFPQIPSDLPELTIEIDDSGEKLPDPGRVSLARRLNRSFTFFSRDRVWGGLTTTEDPFEALRESNQFNGNQYEELYDLLKKTMEEQEKANNNWFATNFTSHALVDVYRSKPDLVDHWLEDLGSRYFSYDLQNKRAFYEAICKMLFEEDPAKGVELYKKLQSPHMSYKFQDSNTKLLLLDYSLFSSNSTPAIQSLWLDRLNNASTDKELLEITLLTHKRNSSLWLENQISQMVESDVPFEKSKAIILCGMIISDRYSLPCDQILDTSINEEDTWHSDVARQSMFYKSRNELAQHWFEQYWKLEDTTEAWAAFKLFLGCVDSRFWLWRCEFTPQNNNTNVDQKRAFYETNRDTIQNKIERNEKPMREYFLTQDILKYQTWPWM